MMVGFVNAGIMQTWSNWCNNEANIGTTVTVSSYQWVNGVHFQSLTFSLLFNSRRRFCNTNMLRAKEKDIAEIIIGLGLLFIGLKLMSDIIKPYAQAEDSIFKHAFVLGKNPILGIW